MTPTKMAVARLGKGREGEGLGAVGVSPQTSSALWQAPLAALERWLSDAKLRRAAASLVLSNRFVRFALVPWSGVPARPDEEAELALACFEPRYGDMTGWTVQMEASAYRAPRIACAIETEFLGAAQQVFGKHRLLCAAVRPAFVAGWNRHQRGLKHAKLRDDGLFAMAESETLVMASCRAGVWHSVRSVALRRGQRDVWKLLDREKLLQGYSEALPTWLAVPGQATRPNGDGATATGTSSMMDAAQVLAGWGLAR
ncbi:MAG: hypothetical protein PHY45_06510 [Rhodocyclaceae bacterium]|nr:hypothetical protein [Rhodocyclaceae bacterium]